MANARIERGELFECGLPGRVVHPIVAADPLLIGLAEVGYQLGHLPLAFRREMIPDVDLADAFAERAVDRCDATLPTIALHLNAAQLLGKECEARVVEWLRQ